MSTACMCHVYVGCVPMCVTTAMGEREPQPRSEVMISEGNDDDTRCAQARASFCSLEGSRDERMGYS